MNLFLRMRIWVQMTNLDPVPRHGYGLKLYDHSFKSLYLVPRRLELVWNVDIAEVVLRGDIEDCEPLDVVDLLPARQLNK